MDNLTNKTIYAKLVIASAVISLLCLLTLHFVSHEFAPAWHMVSEYALGDYKWLLTLFFVFWGCSSLFLTFLLWSTVTTTWAKLGVLLIFVSFVGQEMGGLFDLKHKLHGLAFLLGIPSLPLGALLISYHLVKKENWKKYKSPMLFSAHFTWISLVLMAVFMMLMISGFQKAGIPMGQGVEPPKSVPDGVIALHGYANRILIFSYIYWLVVIAKTYLKIETKN
ncbi:MAG: hypothetical protein JWM28_815 [Chitinophagaceae bacterium]|nr:hypothetical protein [Chitinophagaceae bacterium]